MPSKIREISKESLLIALLKLIQEKHISDITVQELANKAGVSRSTFYRHYALPIDILKDYLQPTSLSPMPRSNSMLSEQETIELYKNNIRILYRYFSENSSLVLALIHSGMTDFFRKTAAQFILKKYAVQLSDCNSFQQAAFANLSIDILILWTQKGRIKYVEEMTEALYNVLCVVFKYAAEEKYPQGKI